MKKVEKYCEACSSSYISSRVKQKYCSKKCKDSALKSNSRIKNKYKEALTNCKKCSKAITWPKIKFCSSVCQERYNLDTYFNCFEIGCSDEFLRRLTRREKRGEIRTEFVKKLYKEQEGKCALTGIPLTGIRGQGIVYTNASIDRIDPTKGYTEENIQLVTFKANTLKSNFSMEQLVAFCKKIVYTYEKKNKATP